MPEQSQLFLRKVTFAWPSGKKALVDCSFDIPGPGLWMLVGSNGCGKSTLFKLISGLIKPQSGFLHCNFKPALMFQNPDHQLLMPSSKSDVMLSLPSNLTEHEREERIATAMKQVGMSGLETCPIHTLSGGQKQRLALAGALASKATLLLLDEPTALLDPSSQQKVLSIVKALCHRSQDPLAAFWITHRLEELEHADAAILMKNGQLGSWKEGTTLRKEIQPLAGR
ncbi:ABC transporter ATP-binding protein [Prochlorococcus sp. MIT 1300]|uniref:ABC transporter ATP-binding protein n=1 Tax=Prochlorococcus sp. MIT 1300 TaxID=3096218 RepID=UPI002A74EBBA|nr:ABC transporter ATP-binding protein [Prochlorococcus sp. MIT 1300]